MYVKVKKRGRHRPIRMKSAGRIQEIRLVEDFLHPGKEGIELCYRGTHGSGIVELSTREFEEISSQLNSRLRLIKSVHVVKNVA